MSELKFFLSFKGVARVYITVVDINDHDPSFAIDPYHFMTSVDTPVGATVGRVQASDLDYGENARIK